MRKALACWLTFALSVSPTWGSSGSDHRVETIRKKIAHSLDVQRRVVVEMHDGRRLQGVIGEAGADDFMLVYAGRATTLSYHDVKRIRWQSPVWKHAKNVAAAAGVTIAIFGLVVLLGGLKG